MWNFNRALPYLSFLFPKFVTRNSMKKTVVVYGCEVLSAAEKNLVHDFCKSLSATEKALVDCQHNNPSATQETLFDCLRKVPSRVQKAFFDSLRKGLSEAEIKVCVDNLSHDPAEKVAIDNFLKLPHPAETDPVHRAPSQTAHVDCPCKSIEDPVDDCLCDAIKDPVDDSLCEPIKDTFDSPPIIENAFDGLGQVPLAAGKIVSDSLLQVHSQAGKGLFDGVYKAPSRADKAPVDCLSDAPLTYEAIVDNTWEASSSTEKTSDNLGQAPSGAEKAATDCLLRSPSSTEKSLVDSLNKALSATVDRVCEAPSTAEMAPVDTICEALSSAEKALYGLWEAPSPAEKGDVDCLCETPLAAENLAVDCVLEAPSEKAPPGQVSFLTENDAVDSQCQPPTAIEKVLVDPSAAKITHDAVCDTLCMEEKPLDCLLNASIPCASEKLYADFLFKASSGTERAPPNGVQEISYTVKNNPVDSASKPPPASRNFLVATLDEALCAAREAFVNGMGGVRSAAMFKTLVDQLEKDLPPIGKAFLDRVAMNCNPEIGKTFVDRLREAYSAAKKDLSIWLCKALLAFGIHFVPPLCKAVFTFIKVLFVRLCEVLSSGVEAVYEALHPIQVSCVA